MNQELSINVTEKTDEERIKIFQVYMKQAGFNSFVKRTSDESVFYVFRYVIKTLI